jgi:hypothetical protein
VKVRGGLDKTGRLHAHGRWTVSEALFSRDRGHAPNLALKRRVDLRIDGQLSDGRLDARYEQHDVVLKNGQTVRSCRRTGGFVAAS